MTVQILIADHHPLVLKGLAQSLMEGSRGRLQVSHTATTIEQAFSTLERCRMDLLILDVLLISGHEPQRLELLRALQARFPRVPVMVLTSVSEARSLGSILATGVRALVNKQANLAEVRAAAQQAAAGQWVVCKTTQALLGKRYLTRAAWAGEAACTLSAREREVMALARHGLTVDQIAQRLGSSARGVGKRRRSAMDKLQLRTGADLWHCPAFTPE